MRLGGIYALEQIATDSRRTRDQATIVEVLSAFVRVHSDPVYRLRAHQSERKLENPHQGTEEQSRQEELRLAKEHVGEYPLPVDVQAAVTVLGRLPAKERVARADLQGAWLAKIHLDDANFTGARLDGVALTDAWLDGVALTDAWLGGATLTDAWLGGATLTDARLGGADLTGARLYGADLTGARLSLEQLDAANGDSETELPAGLKRPEHWSGEETSRPK